MSEVERVCTIDNVNVEDIPEHAKFKQLFPLR